MERTEEFRSAAQVFEPTDKGPCDPPPQRSLSGLTVDCKRVLTDIKINEEILNKINKLYSTCVSPYFMNNFTNNYCMSIQRLVPRVLERPLKRHLHPVRSVSKTSGGDSKRIRQIEATNISIQE